MKPKLGAVSRGQHQPPKPRLPKMHEPLGLAVTVASPCTGCTMSVHSPVMPYLIGSVDQAPVFRFAEVRHPQCEGSGAYWRLVPIHTIYALAPVTRRWWQRKASA